MLLIVECLSNSMTKINLQGTLEDPILTVGIVRNFLTVSTDIKKESDC
jgi:hypothetical protein